MVFIEVNNFFPYFLFILMRQRPINMTKTAISPPRVSLFQRIPLLFLQRIFLFFTTDYTDYTDFFASR